MVTTLATIVVFLLSAVPVLAQQLTPSGLPGVWETRWQGSRFSPANGARETIEETLELRANGTFRRLQRSIEMSRGSATMEGQYEVGASADGVITSVTIRGVYYGGSRSGQFASIVLRPAGETLVATINPPELGWMQITFKKR